LPVFKVKILVASRNTRNHFLLFNTIHIKYTYQGKIKYLIYTIYGAATILPTAADKKIEEK
jgi:hypothetical protein